MSTPLRVGFFSNHADIIGGGEISFIDLVDAVRLYGIDPVVFVPGAGAVEDRLRARNFRPIRFSLPPIRLTSILPVLAAVVTIALHLRRSNLRSIHVNGARCMLLAGVAGFFCRVPVVWHVRVMERDGRLDRIRSAFSSAIVANSGPVAQTLRPFCRNFVKVKVIHNGISVGLLDATRSADLVHEFSVPRSMPVVLAVGRLCAWKRFHVLVEACALLKDGGPPFTCLIVGQDADAEPEYGPALRAMPAERGLHNVVFSPWRTDIPAIMKAATLLALPSDREPFGRVIIEAWGCGLPVIATDAGGPAEIIRHGETGMLVPVGDAAALARTVAELLTDKCLRDRLTESGRRRIADFTLEAHARKIAAVHRAIVDR